MWHKDFVPPVWVFNSSVLISAHPQEESPVTSGLKDQQVLGVWGYCQLFRHSVETLRSQLQEKGEGAELVWDKVKTLKQLNDNRWLLY